MENNNNSTDQNKAFAEMLANHKRELVTERLLDRAESKAGDYGLLPQALDDMRSHLGRKDGITTAGIGEYFAELRTNKPHWFKTQEQADVNAGKSGNESKGEKQSGSRPHSRQKTDLSKITDYASVSPEEFRAVLKSLGVK